MYTSLSDSTAYAGAMLCAEPQQSKSNVHFFRVTGVSATGAEADWEMGASVTEPNGNIQTAAMLASGGGSETRPNNVNGNYIIKD